MNDNIAEIREAVKRIAEHDDFQSRIAKWTFVIMILFILCAIGLQLSVYSKTVVAPKEITKDWYDVNAAARQGDLKTALHIADGLLQKTSLDFDGYYKRGEIHLMMGSNEKAKDDFQTAFKIFPISKYKMAVDAVAYRLNQQSNEAVSK